jgi:diaminopimelate decarboxylase
VSRPSWRELVERFGSPLYVYDGERLRQRYLSLRRSLPDEADVFYAVKANPSLGLLALVRGLGAGAEIASTGELEAALRAGFPPSRIVFAGPGKTDDEHDAAVAAGIRAVHAESEGELRRLDALGRRRGAPVAAGVRVHVPWTASERRTIIGGVHATKFGIPEDVARGKAREWAEIPGVVIRSLHVFNASNVLDAEALVAGARRTLALATELARAGLPIETVDIGGGLGVPYSPRESPLDVAALGRGLAQALRDESSRADRALRLALEPGRYLVAECGTYVTTVVDRKTCAGVEFLVVDGGIHHLLRPALVGQSHPVSRDAAVPGELRPFRVVGNLCTSLDSFGDHALPDTRPGDLLLVGCAGAYGFTESMPGFLSHAVPAEVLILGDSAHLLRPRRDASSHLEGQLVPAELAELATRR